MLNVLPSIRLEWVLMNTIPFSLSKVFPVILAFLELMKMIPVWQSRKRLPAMVVLLHATNIPPRNRGNIGE